jgi:hypothetical protein
MTEIRKKWLLKNKASQIKYRREYWLKHRDRGLLLQKKWRSNNKLKIKEYTKAHKEARKIYRLRNRNKILNQLREYYRKNKAKLLKQAKIYSKKNIKKIVERQRNKLKTNINYKIAHYLRTRLNKVLKGERKSKSVLKLLGCTLEGFKVHLESKFTPGMSFSNYGKWHIDHISPCARFDLSKASEQRKCFHYSNLQPLWAKDNLSKGVK